MGPLKRKTMFTPGQQVCRTSCRRKTVGVVIWSNEETTRVRWSTTRQGLVRISNGRGLTTEIKTSDLVAAPVFVARPLERPADHTYVPVAYRVDYDNGKRITEGCVNGFYWGPDGRAEAEAIFEALAPVNPPKLRLTCRMEASHVPAGCRKARQFSKWVTLREI